MCVLPLDWALSGTPSSFNYSGQETDWQFMFFSLFRILWSFVLIWFRFGETFSFPTTEQNGLVVLKSEMIPGQKIRVTLLGKKNLLYHHILGQLAWWLWYREYVNVHMKTGLEPVKWVTTRCSRAFGGPCAPLLKMHIQHHGNNDCHYIEYNIHAQTLFNEKTSQYHWLKGLYVNCFSQWSRF